MAQCPGAAVDVAWKLRRYEYRDADAAVRALRRKCKGLSAEAAGHALDIAKRTIEEAIRIVEPRDAAELEQYRTRKPNGPDAEDRVRLEQALVSAVPGCSLEAAQRALQSAVIYHII